jgi:hypothetical protein
MYIIASLKKDFSTVLDSLKKLKKFYPDLEILFNSTKRLDENEKY